VGDDDQQSPERPYTLLSCAISLDGYLGSAGDERLILSNAADFDRVDGERAASDAVLVGAETIRVDNPRLEVRSTARREARVDRGGPPSPTKVTVTSTARLDPAAAFFTAGSSQRLVYCATPCLATARERLGEVATLLDGGDPLSLAGMLEDLHRRGVRRLLVEGGGRVLTQLLSADLVDELQLVVAPFLVGDSRARRFAEDAPYPWGPDHRATLAGVERIDDVALLRYAMSSRFAPCRQETES
jgi:5-amino-6-(5-phosphoribosylamino)uracil reductase